MITSKVTCDESYSNKSRSIVGQGMIQLRKLWKYLNWELDIEPGSLKELEVMVRRDFAVPGPYATYVLQTISKLWRLPTFSPLSLLITQFLFLRSVPIALGKSGVFRVTTNVDDSATIVEPNDNSIVLVIKKPNVSHISHMEQAILKQMIASTQSPNNFLQMFLCADYLLSHLRLNDLRLNCIFIIGLVFTYPPPSPLFLTA